MSERRVLITRKVDDPMGDYPGFDEVYYCTSCKDYFVLAWLPEAQQGVGEVLDPAGRPRTVFCATCRSVFPDYGLTQGAPQKTLPDMSVRERWCFTFDEAFPAPTDDAMFTLDRVVMILSGEIPADVDMQAFSLGCINSLAPVERFTRKSGLQLHALLMHGVSDDPEWLESILRDELKDRTPPAFMSDGPIELKAPFGELVLVLVPDPKTLS